jgi:hypothetical protein
MRLIEKDENDTRRVIFDWSKWLVTSTIASVSWESDSGITLSSASSTPTAATNYVSGGVMDCEYWLKCTITTADAVPRIESRSVQIRVVRKVA